MPMGNWPEHVEILRSKGLDEQVIEADKAWHESNGAALCGFVHPDYHKNLLAEALEREAQVKQECRLLTDKNDHLTLELHRRRKASLLVQYLLSRLHLIETGGALSVDVEGLSRSLGVELIHPRALKESIYKEFGALGEDADKLLTGDVYEEEGERRS